MALTAAQTGAPDRPLRRLVIAQDTGGAIRGPIRGDVFWGAGDEAAEIAGRLKHPVPGVAAAAAQRAAGPDLFEAIELEARQAAVAVVEVAGIALRARGRSVVYQYAQRMKSAWIGKRSHSAQVGASG